MEKKIITFTADEQSLRKTGGIPNYASNKVSYIEAQFELGENWQGFDAVRAIWYNKAQTIAMVLADGKCIVPYEVLANKGQVMVNLVGSISENDVLTDRLTTYPVVALIVDADAKVDGSNTQPITPSQFEQFVEAVKADAESASESAESASASAESASASAKSAHDDKIEIEQKIAEVIQQIEDFEQVEVVVNTLPAGSQATSDFTDGVLTLGIPQGAKGDTGNGIASITKTGTSGLVDTYTITYTNGQTTTFTVTNGAKGDTGNGIASIEKTSTAGLVDTYTITYTNGTTTTFTVTNGEKGDKGDTGEVSQAEFDEAVSDLKSDLGDWYFEENVVDIAYPFLQVNINGAVTKVYVKIITPTEGLYGVAINGSDDNWSTQTLLYTTSTNLEFVADIPSGYTSLRIVISKGGALITGRYAAIIHPFDDHSIAQCLIDGLNKLEETNSLLKANTFVPGDKILGTKYSNYFLGDTTYKVIQYTPSDTYFITAYPVEKNKTYYLIGNGVSLNVSLPVACYGTDAVDSNNRHYIDKLLDGTNIPQDYLLKYVAINDGYVYIAGVEGKGNIYVYDTIPISDAYVKSESIDEKQDITIQLFGDSITDNQYGDRTTWANFIVDNMREYNVTVYNDAVGGTGIGHGKSTTTESHQTEEYNYVHDLVTNGSTLRTDANYIVILIGTNNWTSDTPIGDMSSTSVNTIYGALKGILEYISTNTNAVVFVCTIPQRYASTDHDKNINAYGEPVNGNGISLAEYCEPFKKVATFYGMPCVHLNESLGWNRINITDFTIDGLHPNQRGDKMLAAFITSEIKAHIGKVVY